MNSKAAALLLSAAMLTLQPVSPPIHAQDIQIADIEKTNGAADLNVQIGEKIILTISLDEAIQIAMENNLDLKSLKVDKKSTELKRDIAQHNEKKIKDAREGISDARSSINELESLAKAIPDGVTLGQLSQNKQIKALLEEHPEFSGLDKAALEKNVINPAKDSIESGSMKIDAGVQSINDSIKDKLDLSTSTYLSLNSATTVLTTMAQLQDEVTGCGYEMAKKKIALLVRKSYYDAIKAQKIENLKKSAMERATRQHEIAKAAYEEGMRAKDDLLLSKIQMNLFSVDFQKAQMDRKNAYTELKKVLNIGFETELSLVEDFATEPAEGMDVEYGIRQGIEKRVDMKMSKAQYVVDKLNFEMTARAYPDNTYQNKEARVAMEKSAAELQKMQLEVESEIRQSYQTMISAQQMLSYTQGLVDDAQKALEIAQLRYEQGYGIETSALKTSGLSDFAGTIVEVTSAQERLAQVEEKVVQIIFSYNMAKDKYLTDIGTY